MFLLLLKFAFVWQKAVCFFLFFFLTNTVSCFSVMQGTYLMPTCFISKKCYLINNNNYYFLSLLFFPTDLVNSVCSYIFLLRMQHCLKTKHVSVSALIKNNFDKLNINIAISCKICKYMLILI